MILHNPTYTNREIIDKAFNVKASMPGKKESDNRRLTNTMINAITKPMLFLHKSSHPLESRNPLYKSMV